METIKIIEEKINKLSADHKHLEVSLIKLHKGMDATKKLYKKRLAEIGDLICQLSTEKKEIEAYVKQHTTI